MVCRTFGIEPEDGQFSLIPAIDPTNGSITATVNKPRDRNRFFLFDAHRFVSAFSASVLQSYSAGTFP